MMREASLRGVEQQAQQQAAAAAEQQVSKAPAIQAGSEAAPVRQAPRVHTLQQQSRAAHSSQPHLQCHHQVLCTHVGHCQLPRVNPLLTRQLSAARAHQPQRARLQRPRLAGRRRHSSSGGGSGRARSKQHAQELPSARWVAITCLIPASV